MGERWSNDGARKPTADPRALPPGYQMGGYTIERTLGRGGFAFTYLATSPEADGSVSEMAIKELFPDGVFRLPSMEVGLTNEAEWPAFDYAMGRFEAEAVSLKRCLHPNVVHLLDYFPWNNTAYIVMVYEHGEVLHKHILTHRQQHGAMSEEHILSVLSPLLDGLEALHAQDIFHRDIKPLNIYLTANQRPVLLDFGAAKNLTKLDREARNLNTYLVASEGFSPFEQYWEGPIGPWTDLYAVGATVHMMMTGAPPPPAGKRERLNKRQPADPYMPLASQPAMTRLYSRQFLAMVDWALQRNVEHRPQTVQEWRRSLPGLQRGGSAAPARGRPPENAAQSTKNSRWMFWSLFIAAGFLMIGLKHLSTLFT